MAGTVAARAVRRGKKTAGRAEARLADDGIPHVRQLADARAGPGRTNWPTLSHSPARLERVATGISEPGNEAAATAPLLTPARLVSCGRNQAGSSSRRV